MKYKLTTAKNFYDKTGKENSDKEKLEKLGLKFKDSSSQWQSESQWYKQEDGEIEINTLEELQDFIKEWGDVVVDEDRIIIYNDYLE